MIDPEFLPKELQRKVCALVSKERRTIYGHLLMQNDRVSICRAASLEWANAIADALNKANNDRALIRFERGNMTLEDAIEKVTR